MTNFTAEQPNCRIF